MEHPLVRVAIKQSQLQTMALVNFFPLASLVLGNRTFTPLTSAVGGNGMDAIGLLLLLTIAGFAVLSIALSIAICVFSVQLMSAMGAPTIVIALTVLALIVSPILFPLIYLLIIIALLSRASSRLKAVGIKVGLLGVGREELERLRAMPAEHIGDDDPFRAEGV